MLIRQRIYKKLGVFLIGLTGHCLWAGTLCAKEVHVKEVKIALRANRGTVQGLNQWRPTADYLSRSLPGYRFVVVPFEIDSALNQAVSRGEFDFVFTDSAAYVELEKRYGITAIATLINKGESDHKAYSKFGSVIFTRASRTDISSFQDLKGKTFMAVDEMGFGGWRIAWRELLAHGVNPYRDFKLLSFAGGIQQKVVFAVRDGEVDAGCVRTDLLERMANKGDISTQMFKVLEPRTTAEIDYVHSTRLYPEWPFAKLSRTPDELARRVAAALISMPADSAAALAGNYIGWSQPLDYKSVDELLQDLVIGPYETSLYAKGKQLLVNYWVFFVIALLLFITVILSAIVALISNRRLKVVTLALETENHARREAQQQLEIQQQQLESIVSERTASLQSHIEELESYSYSIAHDLRTPLRSIVSFSQILKQSSIGKLNPDEQDALRRIVNAGKHMATLIDDILDLSRVTRTQMSKTTVDLSRSCRHIASEIQTQDPTRQVQWRIDDGLHATGDEKLINLLLQNLLDNAWKYTLGKDHAEIEVAKASISTHPFLAAGYDVFLVRDNGIGFDMAYKDKIFQPFQRLHSDGFEGTGIGLATVQRVVQRHGGRVWAESKLDHGTTIYFTLPKIR